MASKSAPVRSHLFLRVSRLVLTLTIFLALFSRVQGSTSSSDGGYMALSDITSDLLVTGEGNTTETCVHTDKEAILGTLQRRETRYFGQMDDRCYKSHECRRPHDLHTACRQGYKKVGWEACDGSHYKVKAICCEETVAPKKCKWRGSGGDCNGQCHIGEVRLFQSRRGGGFETESSCHACSRGQKAFCCEEEEFDELVSGCRWTGCGGHCNKDENSLAYSTRFPGQCHLWSYGKHFCCPKSKPKPLKDCHWIGQGDCADNSCADHEVTLANDNYGEGQFGCNWGRRKTLCCQHNTEALTCSRRLCEIDKTYRCGRDEFADWTGEEDSDDLEEEDSGSLEERGPKKKKKQSGRRTVSRKFRVGQTDYFANATARRYPGCTHLHDNRRGKSASNIVYRQVTRAMEKRMLQYASAFLETVMTGELPDGTQTKTQAIDPKVAIEYWKKNVLPLGLPRAGSSRALKSPNDYFMDRFGSLGNREPMLLLDREVNQVKGRIFSDAASIQDPEEFRKSLQKAIAYGNGHDEFLKYIKWTIVAFRYINEQAVRERIQKNRQNLLEASRQISNAVPQLQRLHAIHQEFDYNWYLDRTDKARDWVVKQLDLIEHGFRNAKPTPGNYQAVMKAVKDFRSDVKFIKPPPKDPRKYH
ncbi:glycosyl hydrolase family 71 [Fusarium longipes]|uniref:Glycosyl hydrolase family 71 n=1 Tax=Fusarium longipes TaxID=694270 RepID=A0A395SY79_9HYPO|nr:glycosyl hydrolase family 71 [Fusarium longipes]